MPSGKPPLVFFGTPEFAARILQALLADNFPVSAVVTRPDAATGRGRKSLPTPVKALAQSQGIDVLEPTRLDAAVTMRLQDTGAPIFVVAAYGKILKKDTLDMPPLGCFNVHPSLLPQYRGAAPINWALINGENSSGVTIMRMDEGVDTGDIVLQREAAIAASDNYGSLLERFADIGADLLREALLLVAAGKATYQKQDERRATYAPPIAKSDCIIDWSLPAAQIVNLVRGISPLPAAHTFLAGRRLTVYSASFIQTAHSDDIGAIGAPCPQGLPIAVPDGFVFLQEVQLENKKRMSIGEFLNGYKIKTAFIGNHY